MRIGVLADTHVPARMRELPPRVLEIFSSVEIVLHAGDIARLDILQQLQEHVSLTFAVYGDGDPPEVRRYLQETQILEFGGRRVGMIHGHAQARTDLRSRLRGWLHPEAERQALYEAIHARMPNVDAIVFGHTHQAFAKTLNGIFFFNPGSPLPQARGGPSVGLLEITNRGISGRILRL